MLKKLSIVMMAGIAILIMGGTVYAETPGFIVVTLYEGTISLYYEGKEGAPPPIVLVDGVVVNQGDHQGLPDCSGTESGPICPTLLAALDSNACPGGVPDVVAVLTNGDGATIWCSGNPDAPPPEVIINHECVAGCVDGGK